MEKNNYQLFCSQLRNVVTQFPNLRIKEINGVQYLKGILDIPNDEGDIVGSFLIELHFSKGFPYRFPILLETGGVIPNEADWHKYQNSACCITVGAEEILFCKNGLSLNDFIEKHAIAFFANFIYRKVNGVYKNGEYGHWMLGPKQFYTELLKTEEQKVWLLYFDNVFEGLKYNHERNHHCFCGSGKKFKSCHRIIFNTLKDIGRHQVASDFKEIIFRK